MKFDDERHVKNHKESGIYPKIHDNIFSAAVKHAVKGEAIIELGACLGLLSHRLIQSGITRKVLAVEPNLKYIKRGLTHKGIIHIHAGVSDLNLGMTNLFDAYEAKTLVARRVFPEIAERYSIRTIRNFARIIYELGVEVIILEGRQITKNHKAKLWNADLEVEALRPYFKEIHAYGNVRVLQKEVI